MSPAPLLLAGPPADLLDAFVASFGGPRPVVVLDDTRGSGWRAAVRRDVEAAVRAGRLGPGEAVLLTSGSTGRPRGIVRSADSWRASARPLADLLGLRDDDAVWVPGPPSSTLSLHSAWHARHLGLPVLGVGRGAAEPPGGATVLHAVPAVLRRIPALREAGQLPALRIVAVAGDALPETLRRDVLAAGVAVLEYYGAAELSFVAHRLDRPGTTPSAGLQPFPGVRIRLHGGFVEVDSPYLARGYLAADGEPSDIGTCDDQGIRWAGVGDRGRWIDGRLEILGRGDAAVTTGGHTVRTAEVEAVLRTVAGVTDVVVVGVPHVDLGAVVTAVLATGRPPAEYPAVRRQAEAATRVLDPPSRPRRWVVVPELPRTPADKVDRIAAAALA